MCNVHSILPLRDNPPDCAPVSVAGQHHEDAGGGTDGQVETAVVVQPGPLHVSRPDQRRQEAGLALPVRPLLHLPGRHLRVHGHEGGRGVAGLPKAAAPVEPPEGHAAPGGIWGQRDFRLCGLWRGGASPCPLSGLLCKVYEELREIRG